MLLFSTELVLSAFSCLSSWSPSLSGCGLSSALALGLTGDSSKDDKSSVLSVHIGLMGPGVSFVLSCVEQESFVSWFVGVNSDCGSSSGEVSTDSDEYGEEVFVLVVTADKALTDSFALSSLASSLLLLFVVWLVSFSVKGRELDEATDLLPMNFSGLSGPEKVSKELIFCLMDRLLDAAFLAPKLLLKPTVEV